MSEKEEKPKKSRNKTFGITIYQIALAGMMTALAILLGIYGTFNIGGSGVYLIAIPLFLMPLVLRLPMLILATVISVVITDLLTGYIAYTWISVAAYLVAVLIIWGLNFLTTLKIIYIVGTFAASIAVVAIFYSLSLAVPAFDHSRVIKDTIATGVEVAIAFVAANILYLPFKLIPKGH